MNKRLHTTLITIVIVLLFVVIFVVSIRSEKITLNPSGTIGNTAGNLNNRGLFCEYGGVVYFSNPYDKDSLYSMSPNETNLKKLGSAPIELINAGGKYLYYFQTAADGSAGLGYVRTRNGIYRSNLNGKEANCLSTATVFSMQVINNYLYYLTSDANGPHFYKQKIDGSEETLIADTQINPASVVGSTIYFNGTENDHELYALNTADDSISAIWAGNIWYPIVDGDYVYYMDVANNYRLCRYSLSGDVIEVLTNDRVDTYNLCGNMIYYQKSSISDPCLKRMNKDGSNNELIADGIYSEINATSQYVYFHPYDSMVPTYRTPINGPVTVSTFDAAMNAAFENSK